MTHKAGSEETLPALCLKFAIVGNLPLSKRTVRRGIVYNPKSDKDRKQHVHQAADGLFNVKVEEKLYAVSNQCGDSQPDSPRLIPLLISIPE